MTETSPRVVIPTAFQHLLKQAQRLKEEEVLGLLPLLELLAQLPVIRGVETVLPQTRIDSGIDALV